MREWYDGLDGLQKLFFYSAALGGTLFAVRLALMFVGIGGGEDADAGGIGGHEGDVNIDPGGDVNAAGPGHDSDSAFKMLSLHGLTGFFMMFGLVGLFLREEGSDNIVALGGGFLSGVATLIALQWLFAAMLRLGSSGSVNLANAVGQTGTVYLTIPPGGTGKAQVTVQDRSMVIDAVGHKPLEMRTGDQIRVVGVTGNGVLVVERVV